MAELQVLDEASGLSQGLHRICFENLQEVCVICVEYTTLLHAYHIRNWVSR